MHHIQRKILSRLMHAKTLGYAQMRPQGVESNHFAYHLDQLMHEGLVTKQDRNYSLTNSGLALADRVSHETMTVRLQPHIVTSLHITNNMGQTLVYQHLFQPYLNLYGPPQGRIHFEETVLEAAYRELTEKTGLTDVTLSHRGIAYIHARKADAAISKILAHVFSGTVTGTPNLAEPTAKGRSLWKNTSRLTRTQCMPGFKEIQKLLQSNDGFFFAEIDSKLA